MSITINDAHLIFKGEQRQRNSTSVIVIHHTGESVLQSVETIHDYYLHRVDKNGDIYIGIAYHYYVRKDGTVWKGREEWAVGGHAGAAANPISIGICFEGNYESETSMPPEQLNAGIELVKDIMTRYSGLSIKKHCEYSATDCPGRYFPFDSLTQSVSSKETEPAGETETVKGSGTTYYVREQPSTSANEFGVVHGGQSFLTRRLGNGWRQVDFSGKTGYVGPAAWN